MCRMFKPVEIVGYEVCEAGRFIKPHKTEVSLELGGRNGINFTGLAWI